MRLFIQRVLQAEVTVDGETIGKIGKGLLVFVGAGQDENKENLCWQKKNGMEEIHCFHV